MDIRTLHPEDRELITAALRTYSEHLLLEPGNRADELARLIEKGE